MLVFLDLDGVLRRNSSAPGRLESCCLEPFCATIRALSVARIVISSGWRLDQSLEELRVHFPADIAERIVGLTPVLSGDEPHGRYREILAYLDQNTAPGREWLALDDDPNHFPPGCHNLVLVNPERGFDAEMRDALLQYPGCGPAPELM